VGAATGAVTFNDMNFKHMVIGSVANPASAITTGAGFYCPPVSLKIPPRDLQPLGEWMVTNADAVDVENESVGNFYVMGENLAGDVGIFVDCTFTAEFADPMDPVTISALVEQRSLKRLSGPVRKLVLNDLRSGPNGGKDEDSWS
jgi:hypothetical protein